MLWLGGPSRHLGSLTAANWVSFDFNVSYSSFWGYSLINTFKSKKFRKRTFGRPQPQAGARAPHVLSHSFSSLCVLSARGRHLCAEKRTWDSCYPPQTAQRACHHREKLLEYRLCRAVPDGSVKVRLIRQILCWIALACELVAAITLPPPRRTPRRSRCCFAGSLYLIRQWRQGWLDTYCIGAPFHSSCFAAITLAARVMAVC